MVKTIFMARHACVGSCEVSSSIYLLLSGKNTAPMWLAIWGSSSYASNRKRSSVSGTFFGTNSHAVWMDDVKLGGCLSAAVIVDETGPVRLR